MPYTQAHADRIRALLRGRRDVAEKEMFGGLAFLLAGNMCVGLHGDELIVRVDPGQTEALLREPGAKRFDLTGRPMAGWLLVEPAGHAAPAALEAWVGRGVAYASRLPKKAARPAAGKAPAAKRPPAPRKAPRRSR